MQQSPVNIWAKSKLTLMKLCNRLSDLFSIPSVFWELKVFLHQNPLGNLIGNMRLLIWCGGVLQDQSFFSSNLSLSVFQGAKLLCGGDEVKVEGLEHGYYLAPAVLDSITEQMTIYKEEVFGAVMLIIPFQNSEVNLHNIKCVNLSGVSSFDLVMSKSYLCLENT